MSQSVLPKVKSESIYDVSRSTMDADKKTLVSPYFSMKIS